MALTDANQPGSSSSPLAKILPYTTVAMVIALLYVGWVFYSRWDRAQHEKAETERSRAEAQKRQADAIFGAGEVKFLMFNASPGHLKRGGEARLCYGMVNAVRVHIDPDIGEPVKPTSNHCTDITPKQTTTYKITAANAKGQEQSASLTVQVEP